MSATRTEFVAFKFRWLAQVALDAKLPSLCSRLAIRLADEHLNFETGTAWPAIGTLADWLGKSANPVRDALRALAQAGHIIIRETAGGKAQTHTIVPLVDGKPFRKLKGKDAANPSGFRADTLQKPEPKPFRKLKGNSSDEPIEEPKGAPSVPPLDIPDHKIHDHARLKGAPSISIGQEVDIPSVGTCTISRIGQGHRQQCAYAALRDDWGENFFAIFDPDGRLVDHWSEQERDDAGIKWVDRGNFRTDSPRKSRKNHAAA